MMTILFTIVTFCCCFTQSYNFVSSPHPGGSRSIARSRKAAHRQHQQRIRRGFGSFATSTIRSNSVLVHQSLSDGIREPLEVVSSSTSDDGYDVLSRQSQQLPATDDEEDRKRDVTFASPLLDFGYPPTVEEYESNTLKDKPLLLYLPGFDGTYICPFLQFPELGVDFDVKCMTISMSDRSTFDEIKFDVINYIKEQLQEEEDADVGSSSQKKMTDPSSSSSDNNNNWFSNLFRSTKANDNEEGGEEESATTPTSVSSEVNGQKRRQEPKQRSATTSSSTTKLSNRPIYIAGESFGGILACDVVLSLLKDEPGINLKGLALINAATCYDRSQLASKGPPVASLPPLLYPFGLMRLVPLFTDEYSFDQLLLILQAKALPSVIDTPQRESYMGRVAFALPFKLQYMPQSTLSWRLTEWLEKGCARLSNDDADVGAATTRAGGLSTTARKKNSLEDFRTMFPKFRTVIIAGEKDMTLPSIAEAERLVNLLPNSNVHVVEGAGHSSTCGSRIDLAAVLRNRFKELATPNSTKRTKKQSTNVKRQEDRAASGKNAGKSKSINGRATETSSPKRTAMKPVAAKGTGVNLGMEPRYDGADVGINPIRYWSKSLYRPVRTPRENSD